MPNPWLRFLCLRGPLEALPPAWPPVLWLWGLACALMLLVAGTWPSSSAAGMWQARALAEPAAEIVLCWVLLAAFGRRALLKPALQALAMAAVVRTLASWPLLWLLAQPGPTVANAGRMLLAVIAVLAMELAVLAWLLRYWFRLWKQALGLPNAGVVAVVAGMGVVLLLLRMAW